MKPDVKRPLGAHIVDGRLILKWIFKKWNEGMDWTDLVRNRKRRRALVNVIMNFRIPYNAGNLSACVPVGFLRILIRGVSWLEAVQSAEIVD